MIRRTGFQYTAVEEALRKLMVEVALKPSEEVIHFQDSFKRILAKDIVSKVDIPLHDMSTLDGYSFRANDVSFARSKPVTLKVMGEGRLAEIPRYVLKVGEAFKILTGGILPKGSDTVIGIEDVEHRKDIIRISRSIDRRAGVYHKGEDVRNQQIVLKRGHQVRAQDIGLLAMIGVRSVCVVRKPRVAVMPVGSELTDNLDSIEIGKIPSTHNLIILKLIEEAGGEPITFSVTQDDVHILKARLTRALEEADIVLTIGGTSLGEADLVEDAVDLLGKPGMIVHGVKLDPGRVAGFGVVMGKPVILLPGLIQSTINAFIVFGYPMIQLANGFVSGGGEYMVHATLTKDREFRKRFLDFTKITYVTLSNTGDSIKAEPITGETAMISVLTKANGYILSPEDKKELKAGDQVKVNLLPGFSFYSGQV